jgi:hypothetical protein
VTVNGVPLEVQPKTFSTGSFGFYLGDKVTVRIGDTLVKLQLGITATRDRLQGCSPDHQRRRVALRCAPGAGRDAGAGGSRGGGCVRACVGVRACERVPVGLRAWARGVPALNRVRWHWPIGGLAGFESPAVH